jgi:hypothetical protein
MRKLARLDAEIGATRAELKAARSPRVEPLALEISRELEAAIGQEMENFARTTTLVRGRAGGLARAKNAWRYSDGTFMPNGAKEAVIEEYKLAEYGRYAAGERSRAARAKRGADGTFLP